MINFYYFSTTWCGPCKSMKPIVEELAVKYGVEVQYVDCEINETLASKYNIRAVPTLLRIVDGKEAKRLVGNQSREVIELFLAGVLRSLFDFQGN